MTVTFFPNAALAAASERSEHFAPPPDAAAAEVEEAGLDTDVLAADVLAADVLAADVLATVLAESGLPDVASVELADVVAAGEDNVLFEPPHAVSENRPTATATEAAHTRAELMK